MAGSSVRRKSSVATSTSAPASHRTVGSGKIDPVTKNKRGSRRGIGERRERRQSLSPLFTFAIVFVIVVSASIFWIWASRPLSPAPHGPAFRNASVYDRGLVSSSISSESILSDHALYQSNVSHRHFHSSTLGYVTPWNGKGYDVAKIFREKFTHISPVWYQLKGYPDGPRLEGRHNVDKNWIKDVRQGGQPLIVPRVVLEGQLLDILVKKEEREKAISTLIDEILEMQFDGVVLEAWSLWRAHGILDQSRMRTKALEFVKTLGLELHTTKSSHIPSNGKLTFIFIIPPSEGSGQLASFTSSDMIYLNDAVDGFSLMTYDYSSPYAPGPNAPIPWIRRCLHQLFPAAKDRKAKSASQSMKRSSKGFTDPKKILMGINFYGNDYTLPRGGGPIVAHEYISLLEKYKPSILWDSESQEHHFKYKNIEKQSKHMVFYPTLKSMSDRLQEADKWGSGISIWEIGQGLDYFLDLL